MRSVFRITDVIPGLTRDLATSRDSSAPALSRGLDRLCAALSGSRSRIKSGMTESRKGTASLSSLTFALACCTFLGSCAAKAEEPNRFQTEAGLSGAILPVDRHIFTGDHTWTAVRVTLLVDGEFDKAAIRKYAWAADSLCQQNGEDLLAGMSERFGESFSKLEVKMSWEKPALLGLATSRDSFVSFYNMPGCRRFR